MSGQSSSGFKMSCGLPCLLFTPSMAKAGSFWKVSWHDYFSDSESYERKGIVIQDGFMKLYTFFCLVRLGKPSYQCSGLFLQRAVEPSANDGDHLGGEAEAEVETA
jgi:hypothetical protein